MKEINEIVKVEKPIEYVEESQIFYVSDDGIKKSKNKLDIEKYEKELEEYKNRNEILSKITWFSVDPNNQMLYTGDWNYFLIENEEDLPFLMRTFYKYYNIYNIPKHLNYSEFRGWIKLKIGGEGDYLCSLYGEKLINEIKQYKKIVDAILGE